MLFRSFLGSGNNEAGALKLTIQKFYRVAGGSTQLRGVESDIKLPSPFDHQDIGESALKSPLPYDTVPAVDFEKLDRPLFKTELKQRSGARIAVDPEFRFISEDLEEVKKRLAENRVSLNEKARRAEIEEDKAQKEKRTAAREKIKSPDLKSYSVTLDNVTKPELQLITFEKTEKKEKSTTTTIEPADAEDEEATNKSNRYDAVKTETLNILGDLIDLTRNPKTATASTAKESR